jgi:O-antigen/teichoic acid export membrane protein
VAIVKKQAPSSDDRSGRDALPAADDHTFASSGEDLRGKVVSGLTWKTISQVFMMVSRVSVTVLLAHLLSRRDFGLAGQALAISSLALVLSDPSLSSALMRMPRITEKDRSTVFWTSLTIGCTCTALGVLLSPYVGDFFKEPRVGPLFAVESSVFFFIAVSATQAALLTREMRFRNLELREMIGALAGAVAGITAALMGAGAWAIIAQSVVASAFSTVCIWALSSWRPRFTYSIVSLKVCGTYGIKLFFSKLLGYSNDNADKLLVGRYLGAAPLGAYSLAYSLMYSPIVRITTPVQHVLIPTFARVQQDAGKLGQTMLRSNRLLAAITVPSILGLIVVAPDLVPVVLGHKWQASVPVVQLLCIAGLVQALQTTQLTALQAEGHAGTVLRFMIVSTALNVTAFGVGLRWGIAGVAGCFAVTRLASLPLVTWMATRSMSLSVFDYARSLASVAVASGVMAAVVFGTRVLLIDAGVPSTGRLGLLIPLGALVYAAMSWWRCRDLTVELRRLRYPGGSRVDVATAD